MMDIIGAIVIGWIVLMFVAVMFMHCCKIVSED